MVAVFPDVAKVPDVKRAKETWVCALADVMKLDSRAYRRCVGSREERDCVLR